MVETAWDLALAEELYAVNATRARSGVRPDDPLEREVEARFGASHRLAVYGSLAPGEVNYQVIADLPGSWEDGIVTGTVRSSGWGADVGFPVLSWRAGGPPVTARVLVSDALPGAWGRLDAFEGPDYRRILVPVHAPDGALLGVANLYADARDE